MKSREFLCAVLCVISFSIANAAAPSDSNRLVAVIPYYAMDFVYSAALDQNDLPVVLYNPRLAAEVPGMVSQWALSREETVSIIARDLLDKKKLTRKDIRQNSPRAVPGSPFVLISESIVYESDLLKIGNRAGLNGAGLLNCFGFSRFSKRDLLELSREFKEYVSKGKEIIQGDSKHGESVLTYEELQRQIGKCSTIDLPSLRSLSESNR